MRNCNIYIWLLGLLLFVGCTDEERYDPPKPLTNPDVITLMLKFPQSSVATKALSAEEENRVNSLDVLVFKETTESSSTFLNDIFAYSIQIPASAITSGKTTIDGDTKTANIKVQNMEERQRFILLANLPAGTLSAADTTVGETLGNILPKLTFNGSGWLKDNISGSDAAFPMWGQMANPVKFYPNSNQPTSVTINMIRAVARIDIGVNIDGVSDPALGFGNIFKIDKVYLCNTNRDGNIAPHEDNLKDANGAGKDKVNTPNPITTNKVNKVEYDFNTNDTNNSIMERTIYTMESDTLKTGNNPAFLIVKARYYDQDSYYRIDFADDGKYKALLRNHRYRINIVGARTNGYATLEEALASKPSLLNPDLVFDVEEVELKASVTNEQYFLAYSADEVKVDWNGKSRFHVRTDYPDGWKATGAVIASGNANNLEYFDIDFSAEANWNMTGQPIKRTIQLSAGTLKREITVIQSGGSNSYITKPGTSINIPITSARITKPITYTGTTVLWHDWSESYDGTININGDVLTYTPPSGVTGNVVIALKNSAGPGMVGGVSGGQIMWSWHIWVTSENPASTQCFNNGFTFMDRNLGATSQMGSGLYYQWGRKDPFAVNKYGVENAPVSDNLEKSIKNPTVFYKTSNSPYDWMGTEQNNNLWTTVDGEKGPYDPCPFGWRVSPVDNNENSPWYGFENNKRNGIIFPIEGKLDMSTGTKVESGSQGYFWGASTRGMRAFVFSFTANSANHTEAYRANGFPIRCVKDVKW